MRSSPARSFVRQHAKSPPPSSSSDLSSLTTGPLDRVPPGWAAENPRVSRRSRCGRRAGALCAVRQPRRASSLLLPRVYVLRSPCAYAYDAEDWFHELRAPSCPTGQTTSRDDSTGRRGSARGRERDGVCTFAKRRAAPRRERRAEPAHDVCVVCVESAVGPVPRKEALFHRARGSTVTYDGGRSATRRDAARATRAACAHDFARRNTHEEADARFFFLFPSSRTAIEGGEGGAIVRPLSRDSKTRE